jgi:outer membrane protein assembly factor BamD (BamD/ComL family)
MSSAHFYKFGKERKNCTALIKEVHKDYREKHTHTNTHIYIHVHIYTHNNTHERSNKRIINLNKDHDLGHKL